MFTEQPDQGTPLGRMNGDTLGAGVEAPPPLVAVQTPLPAAAAPDHVQCFCTTVMVGAGMFNVAPEEITNYRWHHTLPKAPKLRAEFEKRGITNIHDAEYGWIMKNEDHKAIHPLWEQEWEAFFRDNPGATKEEILKKRESMMGDKKYKPHIDKGAKADRSYHQWNRLDKVDKAKRFAVLRRVAKTVARVLGIVLIVGGAAGTADAAFSPVFDAGTDAARRDYRDAMAALEQGRFDVAERALFGDYGAQGAGVLVDNREPRGLIPKLLRGYMQAGLLSQSAAIQAIGKAWKEWHARTADARLHRDLGRLECPCDDSRCTDPTHTR